MPSGVLLDVVNVCVESLHVVMLSQSNNKTTLKLPHFVYSERNKNTENIFFSAGKTG